RVEVDPRHMCARDVLTGVDRKAQASICRKRVLEVAEAIESASRLRRLISRPCHEVVLMESRAEAARILLERGGHQYRRLLMLERTLPIGEEEELVLDDRPAHASAVLGALEGLRKSRWGRQRRSQRAVAEETESLAMNIITPRARGHIERARRGQLCRKVVARLAQLEL